MKPIFGTTMSGTETIIGKWLNGSKESAIKFLVMCIKVNKYMKKLKQQKKNVKIF